MKLYLPLLFILLHATAYCQDLKLVIPIGHTAKITQAAFSPNGRFIVTASEDFTIKLWDAKTGLLLNTIEGHTKAVRSVSFSPDGTKLLSTSNDKTAKLWDIKTGTLIASQDGYRYDVIAGGFTKDGKKFYALGSFDKHVRICDPLSGKCLLKLFDNAFFSRAYFSEMDSIIITQQYDSDSIKRWSLATGKLLIATTLKSSPEYAYTYSPNGKLIVAPDSSGILGLYDAATGKFLHNLGGRFPAKSTDIKFRPDSKSLLLCFYNSVYPIDTEPPFNRHYLPYSSKIGSASFSMDNRRIVTCSSTGIANVYDTKSYKLVLSLEGHTSQVSGCTFSPNGQQITSTVKDSTAKVWNLETGQLQFVLIDHKGNINKSAYSSSGETMLTASDDKTAKLWSAATGKLIRSFTGHTWKVNDAMFNADNSLIVTASNDKTAKLWNANTGENMLTLSDRYPNSIRVFKSDSDWVGHLYTVTKAMFSPDGKRVLTSSKDLTAKVWDATTRQQPLFNYTVYKSEIPLYDEFHSATAIYNNDASKIMAFSTASPAITILDAATAKPVLTFPGDTTGGISLAGFFPDGRTAYNVFGGLSGNSLKHWDARTGKVLGNLNHQNSQIMNVGISANGKKLLLAYYNNTAVLWDVATGNKNFIMDSHKRAVNYAGFSVNEKKVVTTSYDNTAKVWDIENKKLLYTIVFIDKQDYLTQVPSGYYQSSKNAAKLLHYVNKDLKTVRFEQLDVRYNRPDKVLQEIGCTDTLLINAYRKAYQKRIKKLGVDTTKFGDGFTVPKLEIMNMEDSEQELSTDKFPLHINANDSSYELNRFNVWVNEVPLFGLGGLKITPRNSFDTTILITLSKGNNNIETSVANTNGIESFRMPVVANYISSSPKKTRLHFIGIGINQFANADYNLSWSVKDIRDLAFILKSKYPNIIIDTLFDRDVTKENILLLKNKLLLLNEDDRVIVSYSGHGVLSKDFDYFLSTHNINFSKPEEQGLPYDDLENLLDNIKPRQKLMLIDACHSGEVDKEELLKIETAKAELNKNGISTKSTIKVVPKKNLGMANSFELMQSLFVNVGKGTGATIISAAGGMQYAQERGDLKNGVFTYSIIEAMKSNASLTVSQLKKIVSERVTALTNGLQKPTSRNETNNYDWVVW